MVLQEHLNRILDFKDDNDLAFQEANKKLNNTIMWVNGELKHIYKFEYDSIIIKEEDGTYLEVTDVEELDVFLPEPGMYISKKGDFAVLIFKNPSKQWRKSFNYDLYTVNAVSKFSFNEIDWTPNKIIFYKGNVYYKGNNIGIYSGKIITCLNFTFYQELLDYTIRNPEWNLQN